MQTINTAPNYTGYGRAGSRYEATKRYTTKEIASELKTFVKERFAKIKISIRTDFNHINVVIKNAPFAIVSPFGELRKTHGKSWMRDQEFAMEHQDKIPYDSIDFGKYQGYACRTKEANNVLEAIENELAKYNYDDSDAMIDYFDTKFYSTVRFENH